MRKSFTGIKHCVLLETGWRKTSPWNLQHGTLNNNCCQVIFMPWIVGINKLFSFAENHSNDARSVAFVFKADTRNFMQFWMKNAYISDIFKNDGCIILVSTSNSKGIASVFSVAAWTRHPKGSDHFSVIAISLVNCLEIYWSEVE